MKGLKFFTILILMLAMLLTACGVDNDRDATSTMAVPTMGISTTMPTTGSGAAVSATSTNAVEPTVAATATLAVNPTAKPEPSTPQVDTGDLKSLQSSYESIYDAVNPSVVNIQISANQARSTVRGQTAPAQLVPVAEGSGFVWDSSGNIVTNNHVIEGADLITVTFSNGKSVSAKLVGADPNSDLAVVKVDTTDLMPIKVARSADVKVGQLAVAIGNPFGLAGTMTTGIVSAVSRSIQVGASQNSQGVITGSYSIPDIIQTDAAINPGNSGGVLVDLNGALIGVPSQIESSTGSNTGVGFAIPSDIVSKIVPELISKGSYAHSWLGISGTSLTPSLVQILGLKDGQTGILVGSVNENGPSKAANLVPSTTDTNGNPIVGDLIVAIDGKPVTRFEDLVSYLFNNTKPGQQVTLTVLRDGKEQQVKVTLGTQPAP